MSARRRCRLYGVIPSPSINFYILVFFFFFSASFMAAKTIGNAKQFRSIYILPYNKTAIRITLLKTSYEICIVYLAREFYLCSSKRYERHIIRQRWRSAHGRFDSFRVFYSVAVNVVNTIKAF